MNTIQTQPETTAMYPAAQVEKLLLTEKSRTDEAFEYYQKLARLVGDLERENVELRERLYRRGWLARYRRLTHWASQPTKRNHGNDIPGLGLDILISVVGLLVMAGLSILWLF